jgi:hypothetical protein
VFQCQFVYVLTSHSNRHAAISHVNRISIAQKTFKHRHCVFQCSVFASRHFDIYICINLSKQLKLQNGTWKQKPLGLDWTWLHLKLQRLRQLHTCYERLRHRQTCTYHLAIYIAPIPHKVANPAIVRTTHVNGWSVRNTHSKQNWSWLRERGWVRHVPLYVIKYLKEYTQVKRHHSILLILLVVFLFLNYSSSSCSSSSLSSTSSQPTVACTAFAHTQTSHSSRSFYVLL